MAPAPLALTMGDPAGIGPEIIVKAWRALRAKSRPFFVVGDFNALASASGDGASILRRISGPDQAAAIFPDALPVLDLPLSAPVIAGKPNSAAAGPIVQWIEVAVGLALSGAAAGVVTAPIAKAPLYEAGFGFPGHTEFLGELTLGAPYEGERGPLMMLASQDLRVTLVTVHSALADVPGQLSKAAIIKVARITDEALRRDFAIAHPRIAIAGLNPHAGEDGGMGLEEIEIIAPAVNALREAGLDVRGPFPADTLFHAEARSGYDAAICLYHDQGLIPVKMLDFWGGVNLTLGLPIVRASPDHGTAFNIAGRGLARSDSMIAAIRAADQIVLNRSRP
ncbi:4-hydroxythreonine-4-phosphate dehydrogenase PdxA [Phenylobacterium immobile]|uniref:4-hydroxythreonine-4-phosphate dehydrogenase PdxA n=1 Tax=Phenylobacterium immobile TaxID=21 RepID=UPI000A7595EC|nr:4-hydroxythreonine-4-phosphate dehydrogenase PdxA [Phenylobacterium immobile]